MTDQHHDPAGGEGETTADALRASTETRVDPAHAKRAEPVTSKGPALLQPRPVQAVGGASRQEHASWSSMQGGEAAAVGDADPVRAPLELHAQQLGDHLQHRQEDLDRRAEHLAAQEEALDEQIRSARNWIAERDRRLDERETALDVQAQAIAAKEQRVARYAAHLQKTSSAGRPIVPTRKIEAVPADSPGDASLASPSRELEKLRESLRRREVQIEQRLASARGKEAELQRRSEQVEQRGADVAAAEQRLAERQREIQLAIKRFEKLGVSLERLERIEQQETELAARSRYLDEAEALLEHDHAELTAAQRRFEAEQAGSRRRMLDQREAMSAGQSAAKAELDQDRTRLSRRAEEIDRREAVVVKLRDQLSVVQRDALEMRLAVEELWARISQQTTPAVVAQSIAQIRARLADQNRAERDELGRRRAELEALAARLGHEHARLDKRRTELERWLAMKNEQIEADAARLVARERELDRAESEMARNERIWSERDAERRSEIRRLLALLRHGELKDAA